MEPYLRPLDPHVHLRGEEYGEDFLRLGLRHAAASGLCAVMEQPNPRPNLVSGPVIAERVEKANRILQEESLGHRLGHYCHVGLTTDEAQVRQALHLATIRRHGVRAVKVFWTHSTGAMGVLDPEYQKRIWGIISEEGYTGPVIQHCEDETQFTGAFDPAHPGTHSTRQNPEAETIQVERQLVNARDAGFKGTFYIAHVSNPETVILACDWQAASTGFRIAMEACWHHILLNTDDYWIHANNVKMNPPLRAPQLQERMLEHVLAGHIDTIGTDHAPHPPKDLQNPASGIPGIPFWPKGIEILRRAGIREGLLENITLHNACLIFGVAMDAKTTTAEYNPELWEPYGFNPFSRIDR